MGLDVKVLSFNIGLGAAGTTVTITPGFQAKALRFFWSGRTSSTDAAGAGTHLRGEGFAVSASSFACVGSYSIDAAGTADTARGQRTDACIMEMGPTSIVGWADVQSIGATDVVLEILDAFPTDLRVTCIAIGGSDLTNAEIGSFTATGTAPVNQVVSTGFQGDCAWFLSVGIAGVTTAAAADSTMMVGAAVSAASAAVWLCGSDDGIASGFTRAYCRSGECIAMSPTNLVGVSERAEFVSFNATPSFTINWLERSSGIGVFYLLLKGPQFALGSLTTQTDTTTDIVPTVGFPPVLVEVISATHAESAVDTLVVDDEWSHGVATGTSEQHAQGTADRNGNTTMFVTTAVEHDALYINLAVATQAIEGRMDLTALGATTFTCRMSDADPVAAFAWWVAAGAVAVGGGGNRRRRVLLGAA